MDELLYVIVHYGGIVIIGGIVILLIIVLLPSKHPETEHSTGSVELITKMDEESESIEEEEEDVEETEDTIDVHEYSTKEEFNQHANQMSENSWEIDSWEFSEGKYRVVYTYED